MTKGIPVAVGRTITIPAGWPAKDQQFVVKKACSLDAGQWACVTHKEVFRNNLSAGIHEDDNRKHEVVWLCYEHGPEAAPAGQPVKTGVQQ